MSPQIGWNEASPADGDSAGLGDDQFRSLKSSIRVGLDGEHVWPAAGGDAGVHRLGSARPYFGAQSLVSSTGTDGRLMVTSDTSRAFHVGSGGTMLLGGGNTLLHGDHPSGGAPQRHYWAIEMGTGELLSGATTITFPHSGFSGVPAVQLTPQPIVGLTRTIQLNSITATTFGALGFNDAGGAASFGFQWLSIGSRVL